MSLLVSAFNFTSCKKETIRFTFKGTIKESVSNSVVSGVSVEVLQRTYNGTVASTNFSSAGAAVTDSQGNYEIIFDREKVFEFKVSASKNGYFDFEEVIGSADVSTAEPKIVDIELDARSWVTFHLKNIAGLTSDQFTMIRYNFRTGCEGCTTNDFFYYNGIVDSVFTFQTTGGVYARYSYKNPGATLYIQDSVYTTPFDTVFVNINY